MHASPPLEKKPVRSTFYISDTRPDLSAADQEAWLERFNYASLSNTAAHEAMPGHWLHSTYMRRTPGKVRRIWIGLNPFPQPSSGQDGWAHYAEQLVSDEGFMREDPRYKLAQLSEALTRICRMIVGLRLHVLTGEAWTVDEAAAFFERAAHLPAIGRPMLFVQGSRDTFGTPSELAPILAGLSPPPTLHVVAGGDHSLKVSRDPQAQAAVYDDVQRTIVGWMQSVVGCTHYVAGASEIKYLNTADAPGVQFIARDEISESDRAYIPQL